MATGKNEDQMWRLAVYKDAVVQLVHAPSCSSTRNACLAEVTCICRS